MSGHRHRGLWLAVGVAILVAACTQVEYARVQPTGSNPNETPRPTAVSWFVLSTQTRAAPSTGTAMAATLARNTEVFGTSGASDRMTATLVAQTPEIIRTSAAAYDASATAAPFAATRSADDVATFQAGFLTARPPLPDSPPSAPPYRFPLQPFTKVQLDDARACDLDDTPGSRYPSSLDAGALRAAFEPRSPCDWAILAAAYASRFTAAEPAPDDALVAYASAVLLNPVYALRNPLYGAYFGRASLVGPPPLANRVVKAAAVRSSGPPVSTFGILPGTPVPSRITLLITDADTRPEYHGSIYQEVPEATPPFVAGIPIRRHSVSGSVKVQNIQSLLGALTDLVPTHTSYPVFGVYTTCDAKGYSPLTLMLFLDDGSVVEIDTNPWVDLRSSGPSTVRIGGQGYVQTGPWLAQAMAPLAVELGLPDLPLETAPGDQAGCELLDMVNLLSDAYPDWPY